MAKLKPVLQTRKLSSLPSDLKLIAEELILEKFGDEAVVPRKEKKVAKSTSSFRGDSRESFVYSEYGHIGIDMGLGSDEADFARLANPFGKSNVHVVAKREPGVDRRVDFHTRSSYFVTQITRADTRAFRDAIQRLDYENAPNHKRRASVSPDFARELLNHPDFIYYAGYRDDRYRGYRYGNYIGELFGVPIFAVEGVHPEIIAE